MRIPNNRLEYTEEDTYLFDGQPFTGISVFLRQDGTLEAEQEFREGHKHGQAKEWYPSGSIACEECWGWGLLHGLRRKWREDGTLASESMFEYGIRLWGKRWDKAGTLTKEYTLKESDPAFDTLRIYREAYKKAGLAADEGSAKAERRPMQ